MLKKIKYTVTWFILSGCLFANSLHLGYFDFPPYEFEKNNKPEGVFIEIVKTACQRAGIELTLSYFPFKRAYLLTLHGKIDGIFNFYKTAARVEKFDFSVPVIENPLLYFVHKDRSMDIKEIKDLKGLTVGTLIGYTYGEEFNTCQFFEKEAIRSHEANLRKVIRKRIDIYPCDKYVGWYLAQKNNIHLKLKVLPNTLKIMDGYIGFTKDKHQKTIKTLNTEILKMQSGGEISKMINSYFSVIFDMDKLNLSKSTI